MAIAEAANEGRLLPNFEDFLDVLEHIGALTYVVLWIQGVINARKRALLVHIFRNTTIEVVELKLTFIKWFATHDALIFELVLFSVEV